MQRDRLSWGLADQAVSSLTNLTVGIFVARSLGPAISASSAWPRVTYGLALNVSRGLATRSAGGALQRRVDGRAGHGANPPNHPGVYGHQV